MTNTEKRLKEFEKYMHKHKCFDSNAIELAQSFIAESIQQAIAEDRVGVVERLEDIKEKNPGSIYGFESISNGGIDYAIEEIKLLSSLDPLTDK